MNAPRGSGPIPKATSSNWMTARDGRFFRATSTSPWTGHRKPSSRSCPSTTRSVRTRWRAPADGCVWYRLTKAGPSGKWNPFWRTD